MNDVATSPTAPLATPYTIPQLSVSAFANKFAFLLLSTVLLVGCTAQASEPEIVYLDRVVEVPVETIVEKVVYRDRPVEVVREVPVEKVVYRDKPAETDSRADVGNGVSVETVVEGEVKTETYYVDGRKDLVVVTEPLPTNNSASQITEYPQVEIPADGPMLLDGVWIASNDSLYVMRNPERPDDLEFVDSFEGDSFHKYHYVKGIDFDSEGRLWIALKWNYPVGSADRLRAGEVDTGHAIHRLDDLSKPNTTVMVGAHRATGDTFMSVEPFAGIVVDGEDTVWGIDRCARMLKLEVELNGTFSRPSQDKVLTPAGDDAAEYCQVPYTVDTYEGVAYATALGTVYSIPDFGYSGAGVELGKLPVDADTPLGYKPESIRLSGITIDAKGVAWGWRSGTTTRPREWWKVGDIHNPEGTAQKVADLPKGFPVIRGMTVYSGTAEVAKGR